MEQSVQQEQENKTEKTFSTTIKKLVAILGSDAPLKPTGKMPFDEVGGIVTELLKEEREKNKKEIAEQLRSLLKGHADLKVEIAKKQKELEQVSKQKMEEFNKAALNLFNRIEDLDKKTLDYYEALSDAAKV